MRDLTTNHVHRSTQPMGSSRHRNSISALKARSAQKLSASQFAPGAVALRDVRRRLRVNATLMMGGAS
jgi:hypothetical protein